MISSTSELPGSPASLNASLTHLTMPSSRDLTRREIDRHGQAWPGSRGCHAPNLPTRLTKDPRPERNDQARIFARVDESARRKPTLEPGDSI